MGREELVEPRVAMRNMLYRNHTGTGISSQVKSWGYALAQRAFPPGSWAMTVIPGFRPWEELVEVAILP